MTDYINEHDQWEAIKDWWRNNGVQMMTIFAVALALGLGWRYWQGHQLTQREQASQLFDQLLSVQATPNADATLMPRIAAELENAYSSTPYAAAAALFEAKDAVVKNDLPLAAQKLQWVLAQAKTATLREIATIRLARVLLADKKPDQALALLEKNHQPHFSAAIEQVKGDIFLTQGQTAKARTAYQNAVNAMPDSASLKNYVAMQLNQLPIN
jgi:predicted negative regulator of RcsB-dependent stress response